MRKGLNAYQLKWIALIAMTLDHLAAYGQEIPVFGRYYELLRIVGRTAAPVFLFLLTESMRYTRSKPRFLLRLYAASVCTGLLTTAVNYFLGDLVGSVSVRNIFTTYFYTGLYIMLLERVISAGKNRELQKAVLYLLVIGAAFLVGYLPGYLSRLATRFLYRRSLRAWELVIHLIDSFLVSPRAVEYSVLFVLMGVLMYFSGSKKRKAAVLALFSLGCCLAEKHSASPVLNWLSPDPYYAYPQCWMVLVAPLLLLYNGEKGGGHKWFFYAYYPLHKYVISIAAYVYGVVFS